MRSNEEITLHDVLKIFTKRWRYLIILALVFSLGALIKHKYFPTYPGSGKLIIKDVRNSQLQMVLSSVASSTSEQMVDAPTEDVLESAMTILDTHEFYRSLGAKLLKLKNAERSPALIHFFKKYISNEEDPESMNTIATVLSSYLTYSTAKGNVLVVSAKTYNKDLSVLIVNQALEEAQRMIIDSELIDLTRAESYFIEEIKNVRGRLDEIEESTVKKLQKNQIISVDSEKGDSAKYVSELKKNINDTKIAISNNDSRIKALNEKIKLRGGSTLGVISKFNESSQVKLLEDQNRELTIELQTFQKYLRNYENQKTGLVPMQYEIQKMNANHDFEYKMFSSLNDSLARIGLQKTYVKNKVGVLERERSSRVKSSPSLSIMVLISLMLSLVIGIFSIYIYELFKPESNPKTS